MNSVWHIGQSLPHSQFWFPLISGYDVPNWCFQFFSYPPDVASLRTTIALFLKLCKMKLDDGINLKEKTMTPCIWATSVPAEHLVPSPETFKLQTRMLLQKLPLLNAWVLAPLSKYPLKPSLHRRFTLVLNEQKTTEWENRLMFFLSLNRKGPDKDSLTKFLSDSWTTFY